MQQTERNNVIDFPITKCPPARARQWDEHEDDDLVVILIADDAETRDIIKQALGYGN